MSGRKVDGYCVIKGFEGEARSFGFVPKAVATFEGFIAGERHCQICVSILWCFLL